MSRDFGGFNRIENIEIKKSIQTDQKWQRLFEGWFNNHMMILLMAIQLAEKTAEGMKGNVGFFLEDLEHHYMDSRSGKEVWDAFRWLRAYLRVYPGFTKDHSRRALEMVGRIYDAIGRENASLRNPVAEMKRMGNRSERFMKESGVIVNLKPACQAG